MKNRIAKCILLTLLSFVVGVMITAILSPVIFAHLSVEGGMLFFVIIFAILYIVLNRVMNRFSC